MALPNPWYVGEDGAMMKPSVSRLLSYATTTGVQGVFGVADCAIKQLGTPGAAIQAMPGAYMVRAKHLGGAYEGFSGKWDVAEQVAVSPVSSAGSRRDLVVLVMMDTSVSGSGVWPEPPSAADGPYAAVKVIEGVGSTVWDISQAGAPYNSWSAITLARIDRPASTGVVNQAHITELRSIAALGGTRIVVVDAPDPPPIAQSYYMQFKASAIDPNYAKPTGGSDNAHDYLVADTATKNWPSAAVFQQVAVPDWAVECDAEFMVMNAQILDGDVFGDLWLDFGGTATTAQTYAIDYDGTPGRWVVPYGVTFPVPSSLRGKVITVRTKFKSRFTSAGRLDAKTGATTRLTLNFQRKPDA